jgi:BirA family biotin operon repressor/biotin-[acetyl-CoA-carboxylase] ligase
MQAKNAIITLQTVDSTNNYAMGQVHAGVSEHGQAWLALEQTQGKGQHGKVWKAAKGDNITMSIALDANGLDMKQQFRLSAAIASACHAFIKHYATDNVFIKWPNDIYWNDRKAGGILIENVLQGQNWKWAIAGMGLNINEAAFPDYLPNPISLRMITDQPYSIEELSMELYQKVMFYWSQLIGGNWSLIYHYYNSFLYKKGEKIRLTKDQQIIVGTFKGISEEGKLMLEEMNETFDYGTVQVDWNALL